MKNKIKLRKIKFKGGNMQKPNSKLLWIIFIICLILITIIQIQVNNNINNTYKIIFIVLGILLSFIYKEKEIDYLILSTLLLFFIIGLIDSLPLLAIIVLASSLIVGIILGFKTLKPLINKLNDPK